MDISTFIGILSAFGLVAAAVSMGSGISMFINLPSAMIVLGGTLGATMVNYPIKEIGGALRVLRNAFVNRPDSPEKISKAFVDFSNKARRDGVLSLEADIGKIENPFFRKGIQLAVDGIEPSIIKEILMADIDSMRERHDAGAEIFSTMGSFAPALGMIGTLIGLIKMLQNMSNPDNIGPAMAIALVTTFYGALLANLVFLPVAGKLRALSRNEARLMEMIITGIVSLTSGDNPRVLEQRMLAHMPPKERVSHFGQGL